MDQLFNKLSLNWYCRCQETCRRKACIVCGQPCFYLEARTNRQLSTDEPLKTPEMKQAEDAYVKLDGEETHGQESR